MRILFVCSAKAWGGNEKWTSMAMEALSNQHEVFFIGKSKSLLSKFGNDSNTLSLPFHSYSDYFTYHGLWKFIKEKRIDLIISTKKKEYFLCGLIARQQGIKHLIRLGANRKMNIPFWHRLNYKMLNDGLIVNSTFIAQNLKKYAFFNNHPIHVLHNGIPGFTSQSKLPVKADFKEKFVIVSSGRITKLKGYHLLIEAIAQLDKAAIEQLTVRIIGEGRNKEELEELCRKFKLENTIHFTGFVNHPTEMMHDADLFVLLSEREGLSNSILEAMTLGIPVLSTDTGGIKELITDGETGYLVERNTQAILQKLQNLIQSKDRLNEKGVKAFDQLKKKFAYDVFEVNINRLINNL